MLKMSNLCNCNLLHLRWHLGSSLPICKRFRRWFLANLTTASFLHTKVKVEEESKSKRGLSLAQHTTSYCTIKEVVLGWVWDLPHKSYQLNHVNFLALASDSNFSLELKIHMKNSTKSKPLAVEDAIQLLKKGTFFN